MTYDEWKGNIENLTGEPIFKSPEELQAIIDAYFREATARWEYQRTLHLHWPIEKKKLNKYQRRYRNIGRRLRKWH